MERAFYSESIENFYLADPHAILGKLTDNSEFPVVQEQKQAWLEEIRILKQVLVSYSGEIIFEYSIPRMGKRIDAIALIKNVIFVFEFKVGEFEFAQHALDQVCDYALDLKYFHEPSHHRFIAPILVSTKAKEYASDVCHKDNLFVPLKSNEGSLQQLIGKVLSSAGGEVINVAEWKVGGYCPAPTIIEAATALYRGHSVKEISRSDAGATNLAETSTKIEKIIRISNAKHQKSICFVTGVPGAGKTLVGLNIANNNSDESKDLYSVFLSGNGPLVEVLREALARDKVCHEQKKGKKITKGDALRKVKSRIQNVHNFRDDCMRDPQKPPIEHVAIFDEAQRAWNLEQTQNFMSRRKGYPNFKQSEPAFLISCLDRHKDWAVIVCLVGGGQEINTGEAGIGEWIKAL